MTNLEQAINIAAHKGAVIHASRTRNGDLYVLAEWRGEFVTWGYNEGAFYHGHYFNADQYDTAQADLQTR